jgi:hypothetical protein
LEGGESSSFFSPVPEYIGSLIPSPGAAQGGESSISAQAGTTNAEGIGAEGSGFDAVSGEEGSSHEGFGGDELGCSMDERLSPNFDDAAATCATSAGVQEGAGDEDDVGIGKSSSKKKCVAAGPPFLLSSPLFVLLMYRRVSGRLQAMAAIAHNKLWRE